ncbi:hypothetical protein [Cardinium endosymbiont of Culicoides punctatus]|uniref:hypothetical protein n=1 Tax=Cardinium endosymbiont of Culicoides punctatus TaxID=2304601 RepID=UPI0010585809|nr:hypothetical protein [Cardinium endosymbiont of Culicoides punctatus]TDG95789.1 hypothetical protein CCPUN_00740 [Cardinium endosymbiont of Culicoides punctatus]
MDLRGGEIILFVTEVKTSDTFNKGLLQHCMELTAYEKNGAKHPIYGVLTCANQWIFTKYERKNLDEYFITDWEISSTIPMEIPRYISDFEENNKKSIKRVYEYLKCMIYQSIIDLDLNFNPKSITAKDNYATES